MSSNNIYTSSRILPYVYMGVHRVYGHIYYGYREANKRPSNEDFGYVYKTSSSRVSDLGFDNFDWYILAEFFIGDDAYWHEQSLIGANWGNPLLLNGQYQAPGGKVFRGTKESYKKAAEARIGLKRSDETKEKMSKSAIALFDDEYRAIRSSQTSKQMQDQNQRNVRKEAQLKSWASMTEEEKYNRSRGARRPRSQTSKDKSRCLGLSKNWILEEPADLDDIRAMVTFVFLDTNKHYTKTQEITGLGRDAIFRIVSEMGLN